MINHMGNFMNVSNRWDITPSFLEIDFQADDRSFVGMHKKTACLQATGAPAVLVIGRSPLSQR